MKRPTPASLLLLLFACSAAVVPSFGQPTEPVAEERPIVLEAVPLPPGFPLDLQLQPGTDYAIGRQDLIEIRVFGVDELSQTVRVGDDGSITMPLLGRLEIEGLTKTELESRIGRLLEERFVHDPQVTVFIKEYESKKIAVSGAVREPGTFELLGRKTLLDVLAMAGGLERSRGKQVIVFRNDGETTRSLTVDIDRLIYRAEAGLNLPVLPGDIIYVPEIELMRIFVSGAVRTPDLYEVPRDEPVTVLKAITLAGGTTDRAAEKRVQIIRPDEAGNRMILYVNLKKIKRGKAEDPILHQDDLVLVPEAFF